VSIQKNANGLRRVVIARPRGNRRGIGQRAAEAIAGVSTTHALGEQRNVFVRDKLRLDLKNVL
jgi:hypothetical protein